jgi:hypothetical protein
VHRQQASLRTPIVTTSVLPCLAQPSWSTQASARNADGLVLERQLCMVAKEEQYLMPAPIQGAVDHKNILGSPVSNPRELPSASVVTFTRGSSPSRSASMIVPVMMSPEPQLRRSRPSSSPERAFVASGSARAPAPRTPVIGQREVQLGKIQPQPAGFLSGDGSRSRLSLASTPSKQNLGTTPALGISRML